MLLDRTKKRKAGFLLIALTIMCIGSGGCGNSSPKDPLQDPGAITTADGGVIRYGDTQESVEEILGMEPTFWSYDEHRPKYIDDTEAFYRETDGEYRLAYFFIVDPSYTTYQGIRIGDKWEDVKEKLNPDLIFETYTHGFYSVYVVFDNGKQIDANIDMDEWEEDWLILRYAYDKDTISAMAVFDKKASTYPFAD